MKLLVYNSVAIKKLYSKHLSDHKTTVLHLTIAASNSNITKTRSSLPVIFHSGHSETSKHFAKCCRIHVEPSLPEASELRARLLSHKFCLGTECTRIRNYVDSPKPVYTSAAIQYFPMSVTFPIRVSNVCHVSGTHLQCLREGLPV